MKKLRKIVRLASWFLILILILYTVLMVVQPKKMSQFVRYQFYTVLTDSMEPRIPTYSLVCVKKFRENEEVQLKPQQIITFHAVRLGVPIMITHHFNKIEKDKQGNTIYRTNAEGKEGFDVYDTKRENLIGTYVFHVPYLGKFILFLKSRVAYILYGEFLVIFLLNRLIAVKWEENKQKENEE